MIRADSQSAEHTHSEEGVTQCPKHRKADLEFACNSFQHSTFLLKQVPDSSTLYGLGYQVREGEI